MSAARHAGATMAGPVWRMAIVLCAAAALSLSLGMIFPVQFALDTGGYRDTAARTWAPLHAEKADLLSARSALGADRIAVTIEFLTEVSAHGRRSNPVSLSAMVGDNLDADLTLMPGSTRVEGTPRDPSDRGDWIDISADIARDLGVAPGDIVGVVVSPGDPIHLTVRGVYAAREWGVRGIALTSAASIARHDASIDLTSTSLLTSASPADVEKMLNAPPWLDRMLAANYTSPITVESLPERLAHVETSSFANLALVLTVSILAFAALAAVVVAETAALLTTTLRPRAAILLELGARPSAIYRGVSFVVIAVMTAAVGTGALVASLAYTQRWLGPALPPTLATVWWGASGLAIAVGVITTILVAARERKRVSV